MGLRLIDTFEIDRYRNMGQSIDGAEKARRWPPPEIMQARVRATKGGDAGDGEWGDWPVFFFTYR
jgi:hypothetical protein